MKIENDRATATCAAGTIRGRATDRAAVFLGIPYAEAPIGDRRFGAPARRGVLQDFAAFSMAATPQVIPWAEETTIPEPSLPGDDILSLNIYAPLHEVDGGAPVLVWSHGGGWIAGSPASPWYDGSAFARDGVVVVVISYRLGFDGFGWLPDAPINRGLLDQIAALEWVRDNIRAFGGNPSRVTLAGQSAGGGNVVSLMCSPAADHLFSAAIMQSGSATPVPLAAARQRSDDFAAAAGVENTRAGWSQRSREWIARHEREFMRITGLPNEASPIEESFAWMHRKHVQLQDLVFAPVLEDEAHRAPSEAFGSAINSARSLLIGYNRNEIALESASTARSALEAVTAVVPLSPSARSRLEHDLRLEGDLRAMNYVRGMLYRTSVPQLLADRSDDGLARTWVYDFRWKSPVDGFTPHCAEIPFVWSNVDADGAAAVLGAEPPTELIARMHGAWLAFIVAEAAPWDPVARTSSTGAHVFDTTDSFDDSAYLIETEVLGLSA